MKLKAAALYYALILSVLIAILTSFLILFSYYSRNELNQYLSKQKLIQNCNSGLEYLKSESFEYLELKTDLYGKNKDSILLIKKQWGLYDIYSSAAFKGSREVTKTALIGTSNLQYNNIALYLPNSSKALSISGNTRIVGNVYLSKAGIKRTNIEGENYIGNKLVHGKKYISEKQLPKLKNSKQMYLENMLHNPIEKNSRITDIEILYSENKIKNSFSNQTKIFKSVSRISLSDVTLKGNIIVYSTKEVIINNSANLENILIVAPTITIKKNTNSSIHLIAKDSIKIEENVTLKYPSSIAIKTNKTAFIKINSKAFITGDIVLNGQNTNQKYSLLSIAKNAVIEGYIYCNGIVSHKGEIHGSLFCNKFYLKTPSAIYENYLLDGIIDKTKRNKLYSSGFIFEEKTEKKIVSWY